MFPSNTDGISARTHLTHVTETPSYSGRESDRLLLRGGVPSQQCLSSALSLADRSD